MGPHALACKLPRHTARRLFAELIAVVLAVFSFWVVFPLIVLGIALSVVDSLLSNGQRLL